MGNLKNFVRVVLAAALAAAPASAQGVPATIGIAAAVRGAIKAVAPGAAVGRVVSSGKPLYLNDHVTTGPDSRLQIILLDETVFTIGPNSDMVLDEFVYDPGTGNGKVSAQILKGNFRFVTGKVAQKTPSNMKVALPVGTIGIRGTMVAGSVDGSSAQVLLVGPGPQNDAQERPGGITVTNGAGSVDIAASGYGTTIGGGGAPTPSVRFTPAQISGILGPLGQPNSGSSTGGVQGGASLNSGRQTASGGQNYAVVTGNLAAQGGDNSSFAAQQAEATAGGLLDGVASWSDLVAARTSTGFGTYSANGTYTCSGGVCGTSGTGNFSMSVVVDFGNRLIGGNGSSITISDGALTNATSGATISGQHSFGSAGAAAVSFGAADLSDANFAGSGITVRNQSGVRGGAADLTMSYSDARTGLSASGATARATLQPSSPP